MTSARTLPHNLEAEKSVLGAILVDSQTFHQASEVLESQDFFRDAHRRIFEKMVILTDRNDPVDFVTLKAELTRSGELDEVGGPAYISALTDGVPRTANIAFYAAIVKGHSIRRGVIHAVNEILVDAYDATSAPADLLASADQAIVNLQRGDGAGAFVSLRDTVGEEYQALEDTHTNRGKLLGVTSGFTSVDEMTNGWQDGDFIVLAARPSIGKTALMLNMAEAASKAGKEVAIFSLEMRRKQLQKRLLSHLSGIPLNRLLSGFLGEMDYANLVVAMKEYGELNLAVNDRGHQTVFDIRTACRLLKAQKRLDLVVVDYFQLLTGALEGRATRQEQLAHASRKFKILADEISCPVILLSQLSRAGETRSDKRPILSDLRDTGALEQDADVVAFLHRKHHLQDGVTQLIFEKQRNGPGGTVNLTISRATQTFEDGGVEPEQAELPEAPPPAAEPKPPRGWRRR